MRTYSDKVFTGIVKERIDITDCEFIYCTFEKCKFVDCVFINCVFSECKFVECSIANMQVKESRMSYSSFVKCSLVSIRWKNLQSGSVFYPIEKLDSCYLKYNEFENMSFKKFDFMQSRIVDSVFVGCNLSESNMKNCDLKNTEFTDCDLRKSDFRYASGYNVSLLNNRVKGARFSYPDVLNLLSVFDIGIEK